MERIVDWIRSWPRWLQYGLLSVVAAGIIYLGGDFIKPLKSISWLVPGPIVLIVLLLQPFLSQSNFLIISFIIGYWFLIGALLGKISKKIVWAAIIWLAVLIIGGYLGGFIALFWSLSLMSG